MTAPWLSAGLAVAALVAAAPARAEVSARLSASVVEAGQPVELVLTASSPAGAAAPSAPRLTLPPSLKVEGPRVMLQQEVRISGGQIERSVGVTVRWTLMSQVVGEHRVGPASVMLGARRVGAPPLTLKVVAAGTLPRVPQRRTWPLDLFDPFAGGGAAPRLFNDEPERLPETPPELRVDTAPDPTAFLRLTRDPSGPLVVGEPLRVRVYAYGRRGVFRILNISASARPDFLSIPLDDDPTDDSLQRVSIDGEPWLAVALSDTALVPLKSGRLGLGQVTAAFDGRGYPARDPLQGLLRSTPPLEVDVREPPLEGRPPGYVLGDVGSFQLTAQVSPRRLRRGESLSVVAKLEGTGNLPSHLPLPQQNGVVWLQPTVAEKLEPQDGRLGGFRAFTYIVRVDREGELELGALSLPYWDPAQRAYRVATAPLGRVTVTPAANPSEPPSGTAAPTGAPEHPQLRLSPRALLGPESPPRRYADAPWAWLGLVAPPLLVLGADGLRLLRGRLAQRRRRRREDPWSRALASLEELSAASLGPEVASAIERALFLGLEARLGLAARGILRRDLHAALVERGAPTALAKAILTLLDACEERRLLAPEPAPELVREAHRLLSELRQLRPAARSV